MIKSLASNDYLRAAERHLAVRVMELYAESAEQKERRVAMSDKRYNYTCGFLFDEHGSVLLLRKRRPEWQENLLNGVGGKIRVGETSTGSMYREAEEEIGANGEVPHLTQGWSKFCVTEGPDWRVHFFRARCDVNMASDLHGRPNDCAEVFEVYNTLHPLPGSCVGNIYWLIPMALCEMTLHATVLEQAPHSG